MGTIADAFSSAFRDWVTDGVRASGGYQPDKSAIRAVGAAIEAAMNTLGLGTMIGVTKTTAALLNADLAWPVNTVALVYADSTGANNDFYTKVGASGTGSWTLTTVLHGVLQGAGKPWSDLAAASAAAAAASAITVQGQTVMTWPDFSSADYVQNVNGQMGVGSGNTASANLNVEYMGDDPGPVATVELQVSGAATGQVFFLDENSAGNLVAVAGPYAVTLADGARTLVPAEFGNFVTTGGQWVGYKRLTGNNIRSITTAGGVFLSVPAASINAVNDTAALTLSTGFNVLIALRATVNAIGKGDLSRQIKRATPAKLAMTEDRCGAASYGQSNELGAENTAITTTPSAVHRTFNVGPKMTKPAISGGLLADDGTEKFLVEDNSVPITGSIYGETWCSGFARWFSANADKGVSWFASAAGRSGYSLQQLEMGSAWFPNLVYHVQQAKTLAAAAGQTYALYCIPWVQGETDAQGTVTQADYYRRLKRLISVTNRIVRKITGQNFDPVWILTIPAYYAASNPGPALAMVQIADEGNPDIVLGAIGYQLPQGALHYTNAGSALLGVLSARAFAQRARGKPPHRVRWLNAVANGTTLTVRASAPTALAFNTAINGTCTDQGFKVVDGTGTLTLSSIAAGAAVFDIATARYITPITMTLNRTLGASPTLRYAIDFRASTPTTTSAGGGTLYDTTADTVSISGSPRAMPYAAPPAILPISIMEGL